MLWCPNKLNNTSILGLITTTHRHANYSTYSTIPPKQEINDTKKITAHYLLLLMLSKSNNLKSIKNHLVSYKILYHLIQFDRSQVTGPPGLLKCYTCPRSQVPLMKPSNEMKKKSQKICSFEINFCQCDHMTKNCVMLFVSTGTTDHPLWPSSCSHFPYLLIPLSVFTLPLP